MLVFPAPQHFPWRQTVLAFLLTTLSQHPQCMAHCRCLHCLWKEEETDINHVEIRRGGVHAERMKAFWRETWTWPLIRVQEIGGAGGRVKVIQMMSWVVDRRVVPGAGIGGSEEGQSTFRWQFIFSNTWVNASPTTFSPVVKSTQRSLNPISTKLLSRHRYPRVRPRFRCLLCSDTGAGFPLVSFGELIKRPAIFTPCQLVHGCTPKCVPHNKCSINTCCLNEMVFCTRHLLVSLRPYVGGRGANIQRWHCRGWGPEEQGRDWHSVLRVPRM